MTKAVEFIFADQQGPLQRLREALPQPGQALIVTGLPGSAPSWLLSYLFGAAGNNGSVILLVEKDQRRAYDRAAELRFFLEEVRGLTDAPVLPFPHLENLPYEQKEPEIALQIERSAVFAQVLTKPGQAMGPCIIVAPLRALLQRLPSPTSLDRALRDIKVGQPVDRAELLQWLREESYEQKELIAQAGQYAVRGGIIDIFPLNAGAPVRLELYENELESLREFDPGTQRSTRPLEGFRLVPSNDVHLLLEANTESTGKPVQSTRDVDHTGLPVSALPGLLDFLPADTLVVLEEPASLKEEAIRVVELAGKMFRAQLNLPDAPEPHPNLPPPEILFKKWEPWLAGASRFAQLRLEQVAVEEVLSSTPTPLLRLNLQPAMLGEKPIEETLAYLIERTRQGQQVVAVCDNEGQRTRLRELLAGQKSAAAELVTIMVGDLQEGFANPDLHWLLITDREIFHRYRRAPLPHHIGLGVPVRELVELHPGDYVVHEDYGIARFDGLRTEEVEGVEGEYLALKFAEEKQLLLPIERVYLLSRYIGTDDNPPALSHLGGVGWESAKRKAQESIEEMAGELLELYAERNVQTGYSFPPDTSWQNEFEASFLFEETPDQWRSIEEVKKDMESARPMDRLVCGDVGFGKTEVALRAAFKAVMDGKQVAVLVPTTVLAQQHFRTFSERMAGYPIRVASLSRFGTGGEQKEVLHQVAEGQIEVVIGTHRLLSKDVVWHDLGLLIVDEEQRFGVRHKERLKQMRHNVDVLSLSATPIPRTLYMSMSGLRDMSLVNSPPQERKPVETHVVRFSRDMVEAAILRELSRGGQVYFLHNRVQDITKIAGLVKDIVPDARIAVGHGQMAKHELEKVMRDFVEGQFDILVATTIIENGLDIPNVNTILINGAEQLGLADLYQLRGRVGRERHQAYCYLLIPGMKTLTRKAKERLAALQQFQNLGDGFQIAMRDLEIRGMGNLLGRQQHGHIAAIGFELYNKLLQETVDALKGRKLKGIPEPMLDSPHRGSIPPDYVPSARQRMYIYKHLAEMIEPPEVEDFRREMQDLYGPLPDEVDRYLDLRRLRLWGRQALFEYIFVADEQALLRYNKLGAAEFRADKVLQLAQLTPLKVRVEVTQGLVLRLSAKGQGLDMRREVEEFVIKLAKST